MRHQLLSSAYFNRSTRRLLRAFAGIIACMMIAGSAYAGTTSVTASKTKDATGTTVVEGSFSIAQAQTIFWTATYTGGPTDGNDFYLSTVGSNMADIALTTSGASSGSKALAPGTYYISIRTFLMGPGTYKVKYDPTGNGASNGEPHITTVNGVKYDFQAAGEFVALRDGKGMEVQTRQRPVSIAGALTDPYSGLALGVAINTAVAARIGGHRVTLQSDKGTLSTDSKLIVRVDGVVTSVPAGGIALGPSDRISSLEGGSYRLDFANGTILLVTPGWWEPHKRWYINVDAQQTPAHQGLMGIVAGRNWLPDLPDGSHMGPKPATLAQRYAQLYNRFANAWRVTRASSLFDYYPGESAASLAVAGWPKRHPPFIIGGETAVRGVSNAEAKAACRIIRDAELNRECVFDVTVMGDRGIAKGYALHERLRRQVKARAR